MDWPAAPVDLTTAAELFAKAGKPVHRSNLSRFVSDRNFPTSLEGRRRLVDAQKLFDAFTTDYSRQVMAGETGGAVDPLAADAASGAVLAPDGAGDRAAPTSRPAGAPLSPSSVDPKRQETLLKIEERQLDLAERRRRVVPVEEAAAAMGEAIAELRSALAQAASDEAEKLVHDLALPAHRVGLVRAGLKRFARVGQEAFAHRMAALMAAQNDSESAPRTRLDQLVALAIELRGEADEEQAAEPCLGA